MARTLSRRALAAILVTLLFTPALPARAAEPELTLKQIMADPDWIGVPPTNSYWADDGQSVYYEQKRVGSDLRDLYRLPVAGGTPQRIEPAGKSAADAPGGEYSRDRTLKVYERSGDLFVKNLKTGATRQITRTLEDESSPRFLWGGRRISYQSGNGFFVYDLESGLTSQVADLRFAKDPEEKDPKSQLEEQQLRLIEVLRKRKERTEERQEAARDEQKADPARPPLPFYLGDKDELVEASLSPRGDRLLVITRAKMDPDGRKRDIMPRYVTESGYVETERVRAKVGDSKDLGNIPTRVVLLDLTGHRQLPLDLAGLPGINDDPLKELREKAEARKKAREEAEKKKDEKEKAAGEDGEDVKEEKKDEKAKPRPVQVVDSAWTDDGSRVALHIRSVDQKDRWIATVHLDDGTVTSRHRVHDPAWINWDLNDYGWLRDNATLFLLSEERGYSHLYTVADADGTQKALTSGSYEVHRVERDRAGRYLYYIANASHPGNEELYRVELATGKSEALTRLGGMMADFALSPDESRLLLTASSALTPNELYVQDNRPGAAYRRLTQTVSKEFESVAWSRPEVVPIPSTHGVAPIYTRVYTPAGFDSSKTYPGVIFIHGAGYLQNAHLGWSTYFREFMFHTFLTRHGYVVLDMDYRASAGYGRDWRTAIYRQMGYPELEDLEDGVAWMVKNKGVDPKRIGTYGGSYGGFLTMMALFRKPDLFASGAALRPVTDWAHYNHGYTAAILNTPEVDPEAYEKSSPIEYAAGLTKPLLMCSPMVDDNVFFQDSVRLVQKLIELEKENFEIALYPMETHGFREPSSWLDEYRRIFKLFEETLK